MQNDGSLRSDCIRAGVCCLLQTHRQNTDYYNLLFIAYNPT